MANGVGISSWTAQTEALVDADLVAGTDVSDTADSDTGSSKKLTLLQIYTYLVSKGFFPIGAPTADNQIPQATGSGTAAWTSVIEGLVADSSGIYSQDEVDAIAVTKQSALLTAALTTTATLTTTQVINSVVTCGATASHNLPVPPDGASCAIIPLGTYVVTLEPAGADVIWLNGVALTAGVNIVGDGAASPCVLTKKAANNWLAVAPNWTAGT
jgi:hypothetical protein